MPTTVLDVGSPATRFSTLVPKPRERTFGSSLEDWQYSLIQQVFRTAGGVASGDQLAYLLREHLAQPISAVAHWIIGREVVCYEWRSQTMLPLFQFDMPRVALRPSVTAVIRELRDVYADWCLAMWFAEPNAWLDGATPIQLIGTSPHAVLDAARADRFVVAR